jgi:hypothetical protein
LGKFILELGDKYMRIFILNILLITTTFFYSAFIFSEQYQPSKNNLAIEGYSPVSYFTNNIAEKGKSEFSVIYLSKIYYLTSKE